MPSRRNIATEVVQRAQKTYPQWLKGAVDYIGQPPYGRETIDPRTAARRERIANDPVSAELDARGFPMYVADPEAQK